MGLMKNMRVGLVKQFVKKEWNQQSDVEQFAKVAHYANWDVSVEPLSDYYLNKLIDENIENHVNPYDYTRTHALIYDKDFDSTCSVHGLKNGGFIVSIELANKQTYFKTHSMRMTIDVMNELFTYSSDLRKCS